MCSWINNNCNIETQSPNVPSLSNIQETLVTIGDKPSTFIKSREWIGSFEICLFLDHCYHVRNAHISFSFSCAFLKFYMVTNRCTGIYLKTEATCTLYQTAFHSGAVPKSIVMLKGTVTVGFFMSLRKVIQYKCINIACSIFT